MWTEAVSGKKKLRIQKYPDTCGRGPKTVREEAPDVKYCLTQYLLLILVCVPATVVTLRAFVIGVNGLRYSRYLVDTVSTLCPALVKFFRQ